MKPTKQYFRVDRRKLNLLKFIFEAYDGLVSISTVDPGLGIVSFSIPPGCETDVALVLKDLKKDILIEPCPAADLVEKEVPAV